MNEIITRFQLSTCNGRIDINNVTAKPTATGFIIEAKGSDITENINAILNYAYDWHSNFREGYSIVGKGNRCGIINLCLQERVKTKYESIIGVNETYAVVRLNGKYSYIQMEGYADPYEYPEKFDDARPIINGIGVVMTDGEFGLFSADAGKVIVPCQYEWIKDFALNREYTAFKEDDLWGLINKEGEILLKPTFESIKSGNNGFIGKIGDDEYQCAPDGSYYKLVYNYQ
ncbi:MAG TPA: hypothetical protein DDX40_09635 [Rikenellaceae bacterium]|nr:hypothetical protein [Rikenellaceae bacterium]